jgi:hypothetical protein
MNTWLTETEITFPQIRLEITKFYTSNSSREYFLFPVTY